MNSNCFTAVSLILALSSPRLISAQGVDNFNDSRIWIPALTIGPNKEGQPRPSLEEPEKVLQEPSKNSSENFAYWTSKLAQDPSALPKALDAFEKEWDKLRAGKASSSEDITFAAQALRTLALHSANISKRNPAEAKQLLSYVNDRLKPLKAEFLPAEPYKTVYMNLEPPPGMTYAAAQAENSANNVYNERQSALRSFFVGLKFIKIHTPALSELDEMGDLLSDKRTPAANK